MPISRYSSQWNEQRKKQKEESLKQDKSTIKEQKKENQRTKKGKCEKERKEEEFCGMDVSFKIRKREREEIEREEIEKERHLRKKRKTEEVGDEREREKKNGENEKTENADTRKWWTASQVQEIHSLWPCHYVPSLFSSNLPKPSPSPLPSSLVSQTRFPLDRTNSPPSPLTHSHSQMLRPPQLPRMPPPPSSRSLLLFRDRNELSKSDQDEKMRIILPFENLRGEGEEGEEGEEGKEGEKGKGEENEEGKREKKDSEERNPDYEIFSNAKFVGKNRFTVPDYFLVLCKFVFFLFLFPFLLCFDSLLSIFFNLIFFSLS